jgi:hypothetical protein
MIMTATRPKMLALILALFCLSGAAALAQDAAILQLSIQKHRFEPSEIRAPANRPITLKIKNLDPTPIEFESVALRVEKVIKGNTEAVVNLRPLKPGRYNFFDEFNPQAKGVLVVE